MTKTEILQQFKQLPIDQQWEMLKALLEIVESGFKEAQKHTEKAISHQS